MLGGLPLSVQKFDGLVYRCASRLSRFERLSKPVRFLSRNPHRVAPSRNAQADTIHSNDAVKSGVSILLLWNLPTTVFCGIGAVIVDSADRMNVGWALANICKKVLKTVSPSVAHCDAPSSIVLVYRAVRVVASHLHVSPSLIFGSSRHAVYWLSSVVLKRFGRCFALQAPTTEYKLTNMVGLYDCVSPAVTQAIPHRIACSGDRGHSCNNSKASELLAWNMIYAAHFFSPLNTFNMKQVGM